MREFGTPIYVTEHAVTRWRQRFDHDLDGAALERLVAAAETARWRSTPRHWMRSVAGTRGLRFGYSAGAADACFLRRGATIVTVVTRDMFPHNDRAPRIRRRPRPVDSRRPDAIELEQPR